MEQDNSKLGYFEIEELVKPLDKKKHVFLLSIIFDTTLSKIETISRLCKTETLIILTI